MLPQVIRSVFRRKSRMNPGFTMSFIMYFDAPINERGGSWWTIVGQLGQARSHTVLTACCTTSTVEFMQ